MFFDKHLKYIKLNEDPVDFSRLNLSYLIKTAYDDEFLKQVYSLPVATATDVRTKALSFEGSIDLIFKFI